MQSENPRRFGNIAVAFHQHAIDVFPLYAIERHGLPGRLARGGRVAVAKRGENLIGIGRLGQVVHRTPTNGFDRSGDAAVASQDHETRAGIDVLQQRNELQAVAVTDAEVEQHQLGWIGSRHRQGLGHRRGRPHLQTAMFERTRQTIAQRLVIFNEQDRRAFMPERSRAQ